ncbi:VanZ family protein [Gaoshiqia sediminis]|uniref:VanZ family protein n=1 Tax=Gaoshiqia sediminis TaxID=2986998 RepID=A0AA42CA10_9BACT|nr:VanZ family protein [Gaoshiqia sediminis]MCW0483152.1 VanZ family protein [Gaoshiqia sediminis]
MALIRSITTPRFLKIVRTLCIIWLITILILSLVPVKEFPRAPLIPHFDKVVHFFFYLILAGLSVLSLPAQNKWGRLTLIFAVTLSFSFVIEILQAILPFGRSFSVLDLAANFSGIITGIVSAQLLISAQENNAKP